jgi:hypothetical protein
MSKRQIDLSGCSDLLDGASEFLRMWAKPGAPMTCFIDPAPVGADPFGFGIAMVDAIRHGAKAYAHAVGITEEHALARIWEGFDAERGHQTAAPVSLSDKKGMH